MVNNNVGTGYVKLSWLLKPVDDDNYDDDD